MVTFLLLHTHSKCVFWGGFDTIVLHIYRELHVLAWVGKKDGGYLLP